MSEIRGYLLNVLNFQVMIVNIKTLLYHSYASVFMLLNIIWKLSVLSQGRLYFDNKILM